MKQTRRQHHPKLRRRIMTAAAVACFVVNTAYGNPTGPVVVHGQASFAQSGNTLAVTNSANAIINWQQFSIGAAETTRFIQPSAASAVLNRVVGVDPSSILGALQSNGRVFLINPNGILFGAGARIDTAGLVASSLNISNEDFLGGRLNFSGDPARAAAVVNQGGITASPGGAVYLVGGAVDNQGIITAPNGDVILAAGKSVRVTDSASGRLQVEITAPADRTVNLSNVTYGTGGVYAGLVRNRGVISADSVVRGADGRIMLKASGDVELSAGSRVSATGTRGGTVSVEAGNAATVAGMIDVTGSVGVGGDIALRTAGDLALDPESVLAANGLSGGRVTAQAESGTVSAQGVVEARGSDGPGGMVQVLGGRVALLSRARIDASGDTDGGTVLVGGDYQGGNPDIQNASRTYVAPDAAIIADAVRSGDGGTVIVWADGDTRYHGSITARGGAAGGNGGFVEASGKENLTFTGTVDTSAALGFVGTLLLDPNDLYVSTGPVGGAIQDNTNPFQATDGNDYYVLNTTLQGLAANTVVVLQANNDIIFQTGLAMPTTGAGSIAMTAGNAVTMAGFGLTTAGGGVTMNAGAGGITNLGAINLNGGTLTLNASGAMTQNAGSVISGATSLVKQGTGTLTLSGANTYDGVTSVNAGTLVVANAAALGGTSSGTTVAAGANLTLAGVSSAESVLLNGGNALTGTGTAALTGNVILLTADSTITVGGGDSFTLSGAVFGSGLGINKAGSGTLILSGANVYTGATTITAGTLQVGAGGTVGTLGTGAVIDNAALTFNRSDALTVANVISGTGTVTQAGSGTTTLSAANTYTGATNIIAGTLAIGANERIADTSAVTVAGGATFDLRTFSETIGSLAGAGTVTAGPTPDTLTVGGDNTSTTFSGVIQNTAGNLNLTKQGSGTFTLSGNNTYSGETTIAAGTLNASSSAALGDGSASNTLIFNGGTLQAGGTITSPATRGVTMSGAGTIDTNGNTVSIAGAVNGAGALDLIGNGTVIFGNTVGNTTALASITQNAATTLNINGSLARTTGDQTYDGAVTTGGATTLRTTGGGNVTASGVVNATAGTLTLDTGAGDVSLANPSNDFGAVAITSANNATLRDQNAIVFGTSTIGGALAVTSGGLISQSGALAVTGNTTFDTSADTSIGSVSLLAGPTITTNTSNIGGNLVIESTAGDLVVPALQTVTVAGTIDAQAAGGIIVNGTVTSGGTRNLRGLIGGTNITLAGDTDLDSLTLPGTGNIAINLTNTNPGTGAPIAAQAIQLTNGANSFGGAVSIDTAMPTGGSGAQNTYNLTQSAPVTLGALQTLTIGDAGGTAGKRGNVTLANAGNNFSTVAFTGGNLQLVDSNTLNLGATSANAGSISAGSVLVQAGGGLFLTGNVDAAATGDAITLVAGANFFNLTAATLSVPSGRWLVYSTDPAGDTFGGLTSGNQALWNRNYPTAVSESGNRYVFSTQPTLTFTSTDVTKPYGVDATSTVANAYTVTGFVDAASYGNVFTQDTAANSYTGTPSVTSAGASATAHRADGDLGMGLFSTNVSLAPVAATTGYSLLAASTGQLTIDAAPVSFTGTRAYDGTTNFAAATFGATGTINTGINGDSLVLAGTGTVGTAHVVGGANQTVNTSGLTLTNGTGQATDYTFVGGAQTATITAAPVTVTLTNTGVTKVYDGTTSSAAAPTYSVSGALGTDVVSVATGSLDYNTSHVVGSDHLIASGLTVGGVSGSTFGSASQATDYALTAATATSAAGSASITAAPVTVTADSISKTYGQTVTFSGTEFTSSGLVNGETIGTVTLGSAGAPATAGVTGSPYTISASTATGGTFSASDYTITYNNGSLTVTLAPLSITANDASRPVNQPNPPFSATYSGFQAGDTPASLTGTLGFNTPAVTASPAGLYPITPFGQSSFNYAITYVNGTLVVTGGGGVLPPNVKVVSDQIVNLVLSGFESLGVGVGPWRFAECLAVSAWGSPICTMPRDELVELLSAPAGQ